MFSRNEPKHGYVEMSCILDTKQWMGQVLRMVNNPSPTYYRIHILYITIISTLSNSNLNPKTIHLIVTPVVLFTPALLTDAV